MAGFQPLALALECLVREGTARLDRLSAGGIADAEPILRQSTSVS
jgi:hypothetical protein